MRLEKILAAKTEAERFLSRIYALLQDEYALNHVTWGNEKTGAIRRSSMDLTKSLAAMRKREP